MAGYPDKPLITYSYTGYQASLGDNSFPGTQLDADLANFQQFASETADFLALIANSDGSIRFDAIPQTADLAAYTLSANNAASAAQASQTDAAASASAASSSAGNAASSATAAANSATAATTTLSTSLLKAQNLADLPSKPTARTNLGLGALSTLDTVDLAQLTATVQAMLTPTGKLGYFLTSSAPTGWVKANGGTIGSAASGATNRANADTAALYALIWALDATNYPITTSAGGASTRGASAAADFSANKRLPLPELRAEFIRGFDDGRGIDTGRLLGSPQAEMVGPHTHPFWSINTRNTTTGGSEHIVYDSGSTDNTGRLNSGTENRPRNVAWLACIKL